MAQPVPENIKKRIRELHQKEGLTKNQLAERFSIAPTTVTRILGPGYNKSPDLPTKEELRNANVPFAVPAPFNFGARSGHLRGEKGRFKGRTKADPV